MLTEFHIGLDDTDSKQGGCTTYTATLIFEKLLRENIIPADFPWLVRLNPNVPWKTRGNGALAIHLETAEKNIARIKQIVKATIRDTSDPSIPGTDPAAILLEGPVPDEVRQFCTSALHEVLTIKKADQLLSALNAEVYNIKGRRGIIGALAALGYGEERDHTYEIIGYRTKKMLGKTRRVNLDSVRKMDRAKELRTFNNVDPETRRVLTCPHGPDPVLIGIRGEDPADLVAAFLMVELEEPLERVMIFKTNQGTDAHFDRPSTIRDISVHQSVRLKGRVSSPPKTLKGGHVFFQLEDPTGVVDCAAYQPTGPFRNTILGLMTGDRIEAYGGVRQGPGDGLTVNLEKMEVLSLEERVHYLRPRCSSCGSSCESMGRDQGFRCRKCSQRFPRDTLTRSVLPRRLRETLYLPPPRAHRHLTKPERRHYAGMDGHAQMEHDEKPDVFLGMFSRGPTHKLV